MDQECTRHGADWNAAGSRPRFKGTKERLRDMNVASAVNIDDLRGLARRRLPRIHFDWIDGGAGDETALRESMEGFAATRFLPRYLANISSCDLTKSLLGRTYALPFGLAPVGYVGLFWSGGELALAEAARRNNVPFILSNSAVATIEEAAKVAPEHTWFQLYPACDPGVTRDLIARAAAASFEVLVLTVDLPVQAKRERDIRNKFSLPVRYSARNILDGALHPEWTLQWLQNGGLPKMGSWAAYAGPNASAEKVAEYMRSQQHAPQSWTDLKAYRAQWKGKLIIKGLQHPDDARKALDTGCDGIIISNHGGRQFDRGPTPLESLPDIRQALGDKIPVMIDGGVRRGADVLAALAHGADFVFCGRAVVYGVAAAGLPGATRAFDILVDELRRTLGQIGLTRIHDVSGDILWR
jgi:isopentenyl diphosphate isomerase/L-lactate dehydrogenase-like FMN-dependent dehydrogenase